jgi:hypothetical protein
MPPLLEHADDGDRIVWVESAEARLRGWSSGAREVLSRLGLESLPDIEVDTLDDLAGLVVRSQGALALARRQGLRPHLILNGGPKLTPLGLLRAWGDLDPVLLYGEDRPAVCKTFPHSLDRPADVRPYTRHALDLPEILAVSGHRIFDNQGGKFWPGPLADDLAREPYGVEVAYTAQLHEAHHRRKEAPAGEALPCYRDTRQLTDDPLRDWKRAILAPLRKRRLEMADDEDGVFELIYDRTLGLARRAAEARFRANQVPLAPLGAAFERATARRMHAWLESTKHPAIHSAWRGVRIAQGDEPDHMKAEFDILLVLKSGVLWHLECKSFTATRKDLDARLFNLQQAGSLLARMALCGPLLTGHAGAPWFASQHALRQQVEARRHIPFIPFTLPGQPAKYTVDEEHVSRSFACPALEEALERALQGYRPTT